MAARLTTGASVVAVLVLAAGCGFENKANVLSPSKTASNGSTAPSSSTPSPGSLVGTWASASVLESLPAPSTCGDFQWTVTEQTATSLSGNFYAVCGNLTVSGTASGQLVGSTIPMTASGKASAFGATCDFSLTGTGTILTSDSMRVDYSGTTCLGPVHGSETLTRRSPSPAPAPTAPDPTPAPPSTSQQPRRDANSYGGRIPVSIAIGDLQSQVYSVASANPGAIQASCLNGRNVLDFPKALLAALRQIDNRWGFNCRRGNCGDPSNDIVDYHWSPGSSEGSTDVYIFDVIRGTDCGPQVIDVTDATLQSGTIGRYSLLGIFTNDVNY
jgi:hypothetical protein